MAGAKQSDRSNLPPVRIGTSGWHYRDWWGPFFPEGVKQKDALRYYATRFDCAELNAPFYRTPTEAAVEAWFSSTPDDFRFAWKASKFITHWRRLIVNENSMNLLEQRISLLKHKLGPVLFQLPPKMECNLERLAIFLKHLPKGRSYSFEFRHLSWYQARVFELLGDHNAALCLSDHADAPAPCEVTADWVYIRNHGPSGRYHGSYIDGQLRDWAESIATWRGEGRQVWCFFDNDVKSAAPADAERLIELVGRHELMGVAR
ncbi:DUF72 domain-containing protein [Pseudaminobacter soli (ex Zhang et al. 2022)]|uniref:DUF72 domain-containing protein n=1 Tax=Pseudaminobacter soli (ex Zhang et al. 2022) TaxID=2831468 RepID=UPI001F21D182|nr:DUF72 domain-containing protein [Pseudaminobacter soli]